MTSQEKNMSSLKKESTFIVKGGVVDQSIKSKQFFEEVWRKARLMNQNADLKMYSNKNLPKSNKYL